MANTIRNDDDVRALFSEHLEGTLDDDTARAVDKAIAESPALAAEHRAFAQTLELLSALPHEEAPSSLLASVRARLADERGGFVANDTEHDVAHDVANALDPITAPAANGPTAAPWWSPLRLTAGLAAAAAVVAIVFVATPQTTAPTGMLGAAIADTKIEVLWQAPGVSTDVVAAAAREAGMDTDGDSWVGDRQTAARFFVALKARAAGVGSAVSGAVPEHADRLVVRIER